MAKYSPEMMAKYHAWCNAYFPPAKAVVTPIKETHMSFLPHLGLWGWVIAIGAVSYIVYTSPKLFADVKSLYTWIKSKFTSNAVPAQPASQPTS